MKFMNAIEQARYHIITLWGALLLSFLLNIFLIFGWYYNQNHIRIDIPPEIPQTGVTLQKGEVPKSTVYSFSIYIWQLLNHWEKDGKIDYRQQIENLSPFLTPKFRFALITHYNDLLAKGELQERIRLMSVVGEKKYSSQEVQNLGHGVWQVTLPMRLTEMMSINANVVKDAELTYIIRVVQWNIDAKSNPWGLALDGLIQSPSRTQTII